MVISSGDISGSDSDSYKRRVDFENLPAHKKQRGDNESIDSEEDAPSSHEESEQVSIRWPSYSIHRIKHKKVEDTCPSQLKETPLKKLETLIERIITIHNERSQYGRYQLIPSRFNRTSFGGTNFRVKAYYRTLLGTTSIARFFERDCPQLKEDQKRTEYLIFYYRFQKKDPSDEKGIYDLFAIATGTSWMTISSFRDLNFSFKVAKKIAKPALYEMLTRPLFGKKISSNQRWEENILHTPLDNYSKLTYNFKTEIDYKKLPEGLSPAKEEDPQPRLSVGQGTLRLEHGIGLEEMPKWLAFYSDLLRAPETGDTEKDHYHPFTFLEFLQRVEQELAALLPFTIKRAVWEAMQREGFKTSLRCVPPMAHDYCRAKEVALVGRAITKELKQEFKWSAPQSASTMIQKLAQLTEIQELLKKYPSKQTPPKEFNAIIDQIQLSYTVGTAKPVKVQWTSTLEGEVIERDSGQHYFRVAGRWYTLSLDLLFHVHNDFQQLLKSTLLKADNSGFLSKPWPGKESESEQKEGEYNLSYLNEKNFIVGDKACPAGIEIFDILMYTETDLYLYQVKEEFGHKTRDASSQISNAAKFVTNAISSHDGDFFKTFLAEQKSYCSEGYKKLIEMAGGEEKVSTWLEELFKKYNRENIHFVYAFANKTPSGRKLEDELLLKKQISENDLKDVIEGISGQELIDSLKEKSFLDKYGRVTKKLLLSSFNSFASKFLHYQLETRISKKKLYDKLNEIAKSDYGSTIARISLLDAAKKVRKFGFSFHICQIPNQGNETDSPSDSSFLFVDSLEGEGKRKYLAGDPIDTPDGCYVLVDTLQEDCSLLHALLGIEIKQQIVYSSMSEDSLRTVFANNLKNWIEKDHEKKFQDVMLELVRTPGKKSPNSRSRNQFVKALEKNEIPIKEWLAEKEKLDEKIQKVNDELLEEGVKYIKEVISSFSKDAFLKEMYGKEVPPSEALKKIQDLLKKPQKIVLETLFEKKQWLKKILEEKDQTYTEKQKKIDKTLPFKQGYKSYDALLKQLKDHEETFAQLDVTSTYLTCLQDPKYPYQYCEIELAAQCYDKQIVLYYPKDNEILKRIFNPSAVPLKNLFWRGHQEKSSVFFACKMVEEIETSSPIIPFTPKKNMRYISLAGSPEQLKVGGFTYFPTLTKGVGACLLHAVMGELKNGSVSWQDNDTNARKQYAEDFLGRMHMDPRSIFPLLSKLLKEIPNGVEFQENREVWKKQPYYVSKVAPLHLNREKLVKEKKQALDVQVNVLVKLCEKIDIFKDPSKTQLQTILNSCASTTNTTPKKCFEKRTDLIGHFTTYPPVEEKDLASELTLATHTLDAIEQQIKSIDQQFEALGKLEEIWNTYNAVILSPSYWFTETDAEIIARLYDRKIEIFAFYDGTYDHACPTINDAGQKHVVVFWERNQENRGHHYSQCILQSKE